MDIVKTVEELRREIDELVRNLLNILYRSYGLSVRDEVCFTCLADAGAIDGRTATYLTTLYMSIDELLNELEEVLACK